MAQDVSAAVEQVQNLKGELNSCNVAVNELELQLSQLSQGGGQQVEYTGTVKDYRLVGGGEGEPPKHIFELDCGEGLVLHVEVDTTQMEPILTQVDMGSLSGDADINGRKLKVIREPGLGTLTPQQFIGEGDEEVEDGASLTNGLAEPIVDINGSELRKGMTVTIPDYGYSGTVKRYDEELGYVYVSVVEQGGGEVEYTPDQLEIV